MQNFQKVIFVFAMTSLILACGITSAAPTTAPDQQNVATIVAGTIRAITAAAPTQSSLPAGIPVSFQNVSFVIPNGLASGASSQNVAAVDEQNGAPWDVAPAHIEFVLNDYSTLGKFSDTKIWIYPANSAGMNDWATHSLQKLRAIVANPSAPLTNDALPEVPTYNAAQMFAAKVQVINFQSGSGVRMITEYGQAAGPIVNNGTFYHFEGLSGDGKYYIVAVLPIGATVLASGGDPNAPVPPGGVPFPGYTSPDPKDYDTYYQSVTNALNAADPSVFMPAIASLDQLIQSISIQ